MRPASLAHPAAAVADPLAGLRDIHLPPAPGWWPPAPGWWLLALLLSGLVAATFFYLRRRRAASRPVRLALAELQELKPLAEAGHDDPARRRDFIRRLSTLLRRFCLLRYPDLEVADLHGSQWVQFLSDRAPAEKRDYFSTELAPLELLYVSEPVLAKRPFDPERLLTAAATWLEMQNRKASPSAPGRRGRGRGGGK